MLSLLWILVRILMMQCLFCLGLEENKRINIFYLESHLVRPISHSLTKRTHTTLKFILFCIEFQPKTNSSFTFNRLPLLGSFHWLVDSWSARVLIHGLFIWTNWRHIFHWLLLLGLLFYWLFWSLKNNCVCQTL